MLLIKQGIDTIRSYQTGVINSKMVFRLRRRLFERLLRLPLTPCSCSSRCGRSCRR